MIIILNFILFSCHEVVLGIVIFEVDDTSCEFNVDILKFIIERSLIQLGHMLQGHLLE